MNLDEFYIELGKIKGFKLVGGKIRLNTRYGLVCPLCAVCNNLHYTKFTQAIGCPAQFLGQDFEWGDKIASAADCPSRINKIRKRMLSIIKANRAKTVRKKTNHNK